MSASHRVWSALYHATCRLLPDDFRRRHGAELRDVFDRVALGSSGLTLHRRAARECVDIATVSVQLRTARRGRKHLDAATRQTTFGGWGRDIKYASRALAQSPGFLLSALTTLGLGIGATAAVFNLAYTLWLKPLPYANAHELVSVRDSYNGLGATVSGPEVAAYASVPSLAGLAAYHYGAVVTAGNEPSRLVAYGVTANLFELLGVAPALGRGFVRGDASGRTSRTVLISDRLWQRRFGGDPGIVGRTLELRDGPVTIIGVMPHAFEFPLFLPSDLWFAFDVSAWGDNRDARLMMTVGRLKPGSSIEKTRAELTVVSKQLAAAFPATNRGWVATPSLLVDDDVGPYSSAFQFLLGAVVVLLCIACANIASLFIARNLMREREVAIRTALGASAWQLRRIVLTESWLLGLAAGVVGLFMALGITATLSQMLPSNLPRLESLGVGTPIVACAASVSLIIGTLCGFSSTGSRCESRLAATLRDGRRTAGPGRNRLRGGLVMGEVALSLVLLVAAGLMGRQFVRLLRTDLGFTADGVLTLHLSVPFEKYKDDGIRAATFDRVIDQLRALPGVVQAATVTGYPGSSMGTLGGGPLLSRVPGVPSTVTAIMRSASPAYFATMQTRVLAGRAFAETDRGGSAPVVIVTESLARDYWNGESPVGKSFVIPAAMSGFGSEDVTVTVVGVVADMRVGERSTPSFFLPFAQRASFWADVVIRTNANPARLGPRARQAILDVDRTFLVEQVEPMTSIIGDRRALVRTQSVLAAMFGGLATLLSAVGLYGLLAQLVAQRRHEIGVRRAMGAQSADIFRLVLSRGLRLAIVGAVGGTAGALALQRALGSRVFGLTTFEPGVVLVAAAGLVVVAMGACYLPARRAMRIDPMVAMR